MAVGKYLPEADPGPAEDVAVTIKNLLEGLGGGSQLSHDQLDDVSTSDHHTKYTDAEAIAAIEGEATLDLIGDLSTPGSIISTGGNQTGKFLTGQAGNTVFAFSGDNFDIRAGTGGSSSQNVMRVKSAKNVGIGTNNPGAKLEVRNAGNQLKLSFDGTDNAIFAVDTNGVLTITPSGAAVNFASKALINVLDLDLGTASAAGTLWAMLTAANAGTALLIKSRDSIDIHRARVGLSGGVDTAVWAWVNSTHTGIVLSGALDAGSQNFTNVGTINTHTLPGGTDTICLIAATQELDNKTLDASVAKGTWTASGTWKIPTVTLTGDLKADDNKIICSPNISVDSGQGIYFHGTSTQYAIYRKAGVWVQPLIFAWATGVEFQVEAYPFTIKNWNAASAHVTRFSLSGNVDIATLTLSSTTVTGLVLSGALDAAGQYLTFLERAAPGAGAANEARMYAAVNGALTTMNAVFQDGTVDTFATEVTPLDSPIFRYPSNTIGQLRMRKPHPGSQVFEMVFPDGSTFTLKQYEHHDYDKIAADKGSEGPLPADWVVETAAERTARNATEKEAARIATEELNREEWYGKGTKAKR
ncbi:hypothetical protein LCGC14_0757600 [marine sediment metagenome]|uniref:Uncharacterized protein n=1 Tax=marine sediment metagenome TaxID=412755 RepID=A0A0F9T983_9ZZZZ